MSIRRDALPILDYLWSELEDAAGAEGIGITIADYGGYRTEADTAAILGFKQRDYDAYAARERAAGRQPLPITGAWDGGKPRPIAPFGDSMHNYGAARDFLVTRRPPGMSYATAQRRVQELGESIGLRSGRTFGDDRHLELPLSLEEAASWWAEYQGASSARGAEGEGTSSSDGVAAAAVLLFVVGLSIVAAVLARGARQWH